METLQCLFNFIHKEKATTYKISMLSKSDINPRKRTYEPTYQLSSTKPFNVEQVEKIMEETINAELDKMQYDDGLITDVCLKLAGTLRDHVKHFDFDRYRIIAVVTIGQKRLQSVEIAHSFLWDSYRDNYACYNFENSHIFCNSIVYGVYLD